MYVITSLSPVSSIYRIFSHIKMVSSRGFVLLSAVLLLLVRVTWSITAALCYLKLYCITSPWLHQPIKCSHPPLISNVLTDFSRSEWMWVSYCLHTWLKVTVLCLLAALRCLNWNLKARGCSVNNENSNYWRAANCASVLTSNHPCAIFP